MIQIDDLHHVAIPTTDVERARRFYREILGLEEIERPDFDFGGAWFRIGNRQLHLIVHPDARAHRGEGAGIDSRDAHFALRVGSYAEAAEHLRAHGVPIVAKPVNRTEWAQIYVCDPDGNVIELNAER